MIEKSSFGKIVSFENKRCSLTLSLLIESTRVPMNYFVGDLSYSTKVNARGSSWKYDLVGLFFSHPNLGENLSKFTPRWL